MSRRQPPPASLSEQLGAILTAARGATSRRQLALDHGLSPNTLRELEVAARTDGTPSNPTLGRVEEVAALYGVRLELVAHPLEVRR